MATIELMQPTAWGRFRSVRLRGLRDAPDAFSRTAEEESAHPPEFWTARLAQTGAATFVAITGGVDVGMAACTTYQGAERAAGLFGMWVAPEVRGTGVGEELVRAVVEWARARGFARLLLDVADDNAPAIGLYARLGFQPNGVSGTLPPPREHIREHQRELALTDH